MPLPFRISLSIDRVLQKNVHDDDDNDDDDDDDDNYYCKQVLKKN